MCESMRSGSGRGRGGMSRVLPSSLIKLIDPCWCLCFMDRQAAHARVVIKTARGESVSMCGQPLNMSNRRKAERLRTVAELYPEIADAGRD
jgi:hypothetical protein